MNKSTLCKTLAGTAFLLCLVGSAYADKYVVNYPPSQNVTVVNTNTNNNNNNNSSSSSSSSSMSSSWNSNGDSTYIGSVDNLFFNSRKPVSGQTICLDLEGTKYRLLFKTLKSPFNSVAGTGPDDAVLDGTAVRIGDGYTLTLTKTTNSGASVMRMRLPSAPPGTFSEVDLLTQNSTSGDIFVCR